MQSREDSLWESFPQKFQSHKATGRYINAFWAPFQELILSRQEVYALRACSLLIIPPPLPWRAAPQGDFLIDLVEINLSGWASLVQDVAAGLQVLPPSLSNCLDPEMLNLLHRLEAVTQVKFCQICYYPETSCGCVPPTTPLTSWSHIMEQTLGYGAPASSGGVTTPSTSMGGMPRLVPPPLGISIWDPFQGKAPIPWRLVTSPPYKPPAGRAEQLKAAMSMRGLVPQAPQMAPAIYQLSLLFQSQPATPYQQTVHPPAKTTGLGVTFDSSATKPVPSGSQDTDVRGRQATRG